MKIVILKNILLVGNKIVSENKYKHIKMKVNYLFFI
jgi:hypothetical protein